MTLDENTLKLMERNLADLEAAAQAQGGAEAVEELITEKVLLQNCRSGAVNTSELSSLEQKAWDRLNQPRPLSETTAATSDTSSAASEPPNATGDTALAPSNQPPLPAPSEEESASSEPSFDEDSIKETAGAIFYVKEKILDVGHSRCLVRLLALIHQGGIPAYVDRHFDKFAEYGIIKLIPKTNTRAIDVAECLKRVPKDQTSIAQHQTTALAHSQIDGVALLDYKGKNSKLDLMKSFKRPSAIPIEGIPRARDFKNFLEFTQAAKEGKLYSEDGDGQAYSPEMVAKIERSVWASIAKGGKPVVYDAELDCESRIVVLIYYMSHRVSQHFGASHRGKPGVCAKSWQYG